MEAVAPDFLLAQLEPLRERILASDNSHCFIERQEILADVARQIEPVPPEFRYAHTLERLLDELSTPIDAADILLGRMVEGLWTDDEPLHLRLPYFDSPGHTTLDWPALLGEGLDSIARRSRQRAGAPPKDAARPTRAPSTSNPFSWTTAWTAAWTPAPAASATPPSSTSSAAWPPRPIP